ncbi:hypothetical protein LJR225_001891 [Phenylobacterium sp. LjRoot225]
MARPEQEASERGMSDVLAPAEPRRATPTPLGNLQKFLPLPVMPHHAQWFEAGPVTFGVEARVLDNKQGEVGEKSASIHIFNADRSEEYVRFDCFQRFPHYHYILNAEQHNIAWGYDTEANGPMLPWALSTIRNRLPILLRRAGAVELAERLEREGFDTSVVDRIERAIADWEPALPGPEMLQETLDWYARWKRIHPQFNTET